MPLTTRKKAFKKAGAVMEEELPETTYGRVMGNFSKRDMEELFMLIKGREERMQVMTDAIENNIPLPVLIQRLKEQKRNLR
jgi:hypothetical protein